MDEDFQVGDECRYYDHGLGESVRCWISRASDDGLIGITVFRDEPNLVHHWARAKDLRIVLYARKRLRGAA